MTDYNKTHDFMVRSSSLRDVTIRLDGNDITNCVQSYTIEHQCQQLPRVELRLSIYEMLKEGQAYVAIPKKTHETLVKLGWTPPKEAENAGDSGCSDGGTTQG